MEVAQTLACQDTESTGFLTRKKNGALFRAWVCFVQLKRQDVSSASATKNAVVWGAHFRQEDYHPSNLLEFSVGCRSKNQVPPLTPVVVPSVPTASSGPLSAAALGAATGGRHGHRSGRDSAQRKRKLQRFPQCIISLAARQA